MESVMMNILVTGGAGFIGSHACVVLMQAGHQVTVLDNFSNSEASVLARIGQIVGRQPDLAEADIRDEAALREILSKSRFDAVMHFAGLKAVGESVAQPSRYWEWNVGGTITLLKVMAERGVKTLVFSSSATVYGDPASVPIREDAAVDATNPYGRTKLVIEQMLFDVAASDPAWKIARLRYFNPVGAHSSGLIGESPQGVPNNLMPYVTQVAVGIRPELSVFGNDYPTPDGTGVRDYIHVVDLAEGHLAALNAMQARNGLMTVNLGTGKGVSVLEMIAALEVASGRKVPYRIAPRRPGDVAACYADVRLAEDLLGWRARRGVSEMCADAWRWEMSRQK
jgi:UDP-glucose 4-epimerase